MAAPARSDALAGATVLIVDDDDVVRFAISRLLARVGARVCVAAGGDQAIRIAEEEHLDLVLTDMDMPGRDGAAVAQALGALCPHIVVVFMSGRPRELHLANGRLGVGDVLIEKPFDGAQLVDMLAAALGEQAR